MTNRSVFKMHVNQLNIVQISDLHLGHRRTPTAKIIENLNKALPNDYTFSEIDLLIITGDVFDTLLHLPNPEVFHIRLWINRLLRLCKKHDVVLRVLEGTPSHDWKQSRLFTHINELVEIGADVRFVETLSIETIERFGLTVLYCPDEWKPTCDDIWIDVVSLLKAHQLETVDIALIHGAFEHQLPAHITLNTHKIERYSRIVRFLVFIGHIHFHSINERIVCPGSFDRLAHGEENPKGFIKARLYKTGTYELVFVENKDAARYITIDATNTDPDTFLQSAYERLKTLPQDAHVRFLIQRDESLLLKIEKLKLEFLSMEITRKIQTQSQTTTAETLSLTTQQPTLVLTHTTLPKLLIERLVQLDLSQQARQRAEDLLNAALPTTTDLHP